MPTPTVNSLVAVPEESMMLRVCFEVEMTTRVVSGVPPWRKLVGIHAALCAGAGAAAVAVEGNC